MAQPTGARTRPQLIGPGMRRLAQERATAPVARDVADTATEKSSTAAEPSSSEPPQALTKRSSEPKLTSPQIGGLVAPQQPASAPLENPIARASASATVVDVATAQIEALRQSLPAELQASVTSAFESVMKLSVSPKTIAELESAHTSFVPLQRGPKFLILRSISRGSYDINPNARGPSVTTALNVFNDFRTFSNNKRLGDRFALHPKLLQLLRDQKIEFKWLAAIDPTYGGAALIGNTINFDNDVSTDQEYFEQYAFHEIGHATLQRWLLKGVAVDENKAANPTADLLSADGLTFYNAWKALSGTATRKYLFVPPNLGIKGRADFPPMSRTERENYVGAKFSEFCAESCMHMVLMPEDLEDYVKSLQNGDAPQAVKDAYQSALGVLRKFQAQFL
jgi:hypothetical protein